VILNRLPASEDDPAVGLLASQWSRMSSRERRALAEWAREERLTLEQARVRAVWLGIILVRLEQTMPQAVRIGAKWLIGANGRKRLVIPSRDLDEDQWARWWRARAPVGPILGHPTWRPSAAVRGRQQSGRT
jgi:hypothetical protein